jgi:hypothetical protein
MEDNLLNYIIEIYNWYFMKYDNPPRKSDLINWTAIFKINDQINSDEVINFSQTFLNKNSSIKADKTNSIIIDEILSRSFGQVLFVHQLHHIYCDLFESEIDTSYVEFVDYILRNDIESLEIEFMDKLIHKYNFSIEFSWSTAKHILKHPVRKLPSYKECAVEVEKIIDSNFIFKPL